MHTHFKALVSELAKPIQTLSTTRIIHCFVAKHPVSDDPFYVTKLVRFYAINNDLVSARNLFDETPHRSIYLWNSIIRAYAQAHKFHDTFALFGELLNSEIKPDNYTLACILRACSEKFHVDGLKIVHGKVIALGLRLDSICNSALVSSYSKLGLVNEASYVFHGIREPDLVLWNAIISGYRSWGYWENGLNFFRTMRYMGIMPDGYTIVGLLAGVTDPSLLKVVETIHGFALKCGLVLNDHVGSSLVSYYSRCKRMDLASRVFESLFKPDLVSWSSLITGYSQAGDYLNTLGFFREFLMTGGRVDHVLLTSVLAASAESALAGAGCEIHGYAVRHECNTNIVIASALIDMYAKCGFLDIGINIFKTMPRKNIITYNSIVSGLGLYGRAADAFQTFDEILKVGLEPDETTFCGILCACCHAGLIDHGHEYFRRMENEFGIRANIEHHIYMVKLFGMNGHLEGAYDFITSLPEPIDSSIWGALLSCCDSVKNYELSEVIAHQLFGSKCKNRKYRVMFSNLLAADGRWNDANQLRVDKKGMNRKMPGISWTMK